jgi:hypothetical protein
MEAEERPFRYVIRTSPHKNWSLNSEIRKRDEVGLSVALTAATRVRITYCLGEAAGVPFSGGREINCGSGVGACGAASNALRSRFTAPIRPFSALCTTTRTV